MEEERKLEMKRIDREVKTYMGKVKEFLRDKNGGSIPPSWGASIKLLDSYYREFLILNYEVGNLDSMFVMNRFGVPAMHPLYNCRNQSAVRLESILDKLGLTMKSAIKLDVTKPIEEESPLEKYLRGGDDSDDE